MLKRLFLAKRIWTSKLLAEKPYSPRRTLFNASFCRTCWEQRQSCLVHVILLGDKLVQIGGIAPPICNRLRLQGGAMAARGVTLSID
jgi:hypothetical protein